MLYLYNIARGKRLRIIAQDEGIQSPALIHIEHDQRPASCSLQLQGILGLAVEPIEELLQRLDLLSGWHFIAPGEIRAVGGETKKNLGKLTLSAFAELLSEYREEGLWTAGGVAGLTWLPWRAEVLAWIEWPG